VSGINLSCLSVVTAQNSLANDGVFLLNRGLLTDNGNNLLLRVQLYCKDKAHKLEPLADIWMDD